MRAGGALVVADIEVWSELRCRDVQTAADVRVARRHGREHDREPAQEREGSLRSRRERIGDWGLRIGKNRPREDDDDEDERVLAGQRERTNREAQYEPALRH